MNQNENQLLYGDIRSIFFKFLLPSIGGMLGNSLYILGDTIMVGQALGGPGLAAVNLSIPMLKLANSIGLVTGVGGATALAVNRGRGDIERGNEIFNLSLKVGIFLGVILTLLNVIFIDDITYLLGATDYSFQMTKVYLQIVMSTTIPTILSISLGLFIRNDGSPNLVMFASLAASFFNLVLDYILIFIFDLGIVGGAIATALSPIVSVLILMSHFTKGKNQLVFEKTSLNYSLIKRIIQNGIPSSIIELSAGIVVFMFNSIIMNISGDLGVSAYSIIANLSLVFNAIFNGMGQAIQPIVSINYGAKKMDRVYKSMKLGVLTSFISGIIFYSLGYFIPDKLASLFTQDTGELLSITINGIQLYFSAFIFMGVNIVLTSYIQSMESYYISTIISLLRGSIYVILVLLILPKLLGINGVWLTVFVVEIITLITCSIMFDDFRSAVKYVLTN